MRLDDKSTVKLSVIQIVHQLQYPIATNALFEPVSFINQTIQTYKLIRTDVRIEFLESKMIYNAVTNQ